MSDAVRERVAEIVDNVADDVMDSGPLTALQSRKVADRILALLAPSGEPTEPPGNQRCFRCGYVTADASNCPTCAARERGEDDPVFVSDDASPFVPLCVFCNEPWTPKMVIDLETTMGYDTFDSYPDGFEGKISIACDKCGRVVYVKEVNE